MMNQAWVWFLGQLLLAMLGSQALVAAENTIVIAGLYNLSEKHDGQPVPNASARGMQLAVEEINHAGGIKNRQLELQLFDVRNSSEEARDAMIRAIEIHPTAVFGARYSTKTLAIAPLAERHKVILISAISTHPDITINHDYVFRVCFTDTYQGRALADFAFHEKKITNIATIFNGNSQYGKRISEIFRKQMSVHGGHVIEIPYVGQESIPMILERIAEIPTLNGIFLATHGPEGAKLLSALRQNNTNGQQMFEKTILGGDSLDDILTYYSPPDEHNLFITSHWSEEQDSEPMSRKFIQAFKKRYEGVKIIPVEAVLAYDAVYVFKDAIERATSLDTPSVLKALRETKDLNRVTGSITFDEHGDPLSKQVSILKVSHGGYTFFKKYTAPITYPQPNSAFNIQAQVDPSTEDKPECGLAEPFGQIFGGPRNCHANWEKTAVLIGILLALFSLAGSGFWKIYSKKRKSLLLSGYYRSLDHIKLKYQKESDEAKYEVRTLCDQLKEDFKQQRLESHSYKTLMDEANHLLRQIEKHQIFASTPDAPEIGKILKKALENKTISQKEYDKFEQAISLDENLDMEKRNVLTRKLRDYLETQKKMDSRPLED